MKAATQRPRIARSWQVVRSTNAAGGGKWSLVKGDLVETEAACPGSQSFDQHLPALSDILKTVEPEKINVPPQGGDELGLPGDVVERTPLLPKCAAFINVSEAEGDRIVPAKAQLSSLEVGEGGATAGIIRGPAGSHLKFSIISPSHQSTRMPGSIVNPGSGAASGRLYRRQAEHQEVERCSKRQCIGTASGVNHSAASSIESTATMSPLKQGEGLPYATDSQSWLLSSKKAVSMTVPAPRERGADLLRTSVGVRTSVDDGDEGQAFQVCHDGGQVDASALSGDVGDNSILDAGRGIAWDVRANYPTTFRGPSLFTSGAGRKLTISDAAIKRAVAMFETPSSAEVVHCEDAAVPCEYSPKPDVLDLDLRQAVTPPEGSARFVPGDGVDDAHVSVSISAGVPSGEPGANRPAAPLESPRFRRRVGWKSTLSDEAIERAANILEGTVAEVVKSKSNLNSCMDSRESNRETEPLEGSAFGYVCNPGIVESRSVMSYNVGANCSAEDTMPLLFTTGAGRNLTVSKSSLRSAEVFLDRDICAQLVQDEEAAAPCADTSKQQGSGLALSSDVGHSKDSANSCPGHPLVTRSSAAAPSSSITCVTHQGVNTMLLPSTPGSLRKISTPDAAIRRAGASLDGDTIAECPPSKEPLQCRSGWQQRVSKVDVRKALEILESSVDAKTNPSTCLLDKFGTGMGKKVADGLPPKQKILRDKLVTTLSSDLSQGSSQKTVRSSEKFPLCADQQQSKFPISSQGCPTTTPFKPPRLIRPLESQQVQENCTKEGTANFVKNQGGNRVKMSPGTSYSVVKSQEVKDDQSPKQLTSRTNMHQHPGHQPEVTVMNKCVNGVSAENATFFKVKTASGDVGVEDFRMMLLKAGVDQGYVSSQWVSNHYKWIVWKLASYERGSPKQAAGKFLNVQRVYSELRHRYFREYQNGHRSAIKRITERDSASSQMMVLCVSSTKTVFCNNDVPADGPFQNVSERSSRSSIIELTDGWYRINAALDQPLSDLLQNGKIFVGQKLRICGAVFHGCADGMPPLEAFSVSMLALHMNGTFRAHRADTLGFCRALPVPLALRWVKVNGGVVAATIVVVKRLYPILFKERLKDGRSVVRCARAEDRAEALYATRRDLVLDELEVSRDGCALPVDDDAADEGSKLFAQLAAAAEPELMFATLTKAQQDSVAEFQTEREISVQKRAREVLEQADLLRRDVCPLLEIRVSEVRSRTSDYSDPEDEFKEGLLTVWNPTEDQILSITEGTLYRISDLIASDRSFNSSDKSLLQLRTTKSSKWQELCTTAADKLLFAFTPRFPTQISTLEQIPDGGEFDIACAVLHVGKVHQDGFRIVQWIFVADGTFETEEASELVLAQILAIKHCASMDAFVPLESKMDGCLLGYCNLRKRRWDAQFDAWTADAPQTAEFSSKLTTGRFKHLETAASRVRKWVAEAPSEVELLRDKVIYNMLK